MVSLVCADYDQTKWWSADFHVHVRTVASLRPQRVIPVRVVKTFQSRSLLQPRVAVGTGGDERRAESTIVNAEAVQR